MMIIIVIILNNITYLLQSYNLVACSCSSKNFLVNVNAATCNMLYHADE